MRERNGVKIPIDLLAATEESLRKASILDGSRSLVGRIRKRVDLCIYQIPNENMVKDYRKVIIIYPWTLERLVIVLLNNYRLVGYYNWKMWKDAVRIREEKKG